MHPQSSTTSSFLCSQSRLSFSTPASKSQPINLEEDLQSVSSIGVSRPSGIVATDSLVIDSALQVHPGGYIFYTFNTSQKFNEWWLQTEYGAGVAAGSDRRYMNPNWDSSGRTAEAWSLFHEAAERVTGRPKIICKLCDEVLEHPNNKNAGSSGLKIHIESKGCKKKAHMRGLDSAQTRLDLQFKAGLDR